MFSGVSFIFCQSERVNLSNRNEGIRNMRHKGNISEVNIYRNRKINSLFREIRRTGTCSTVGEICRKIADMNQERHYISEERAGEVYYRYLKTGEIQGCSHYTRLLYSSLIEACEHIRTGKGMVCVRYIVREAIERPAHCIGISPNRIHRVLREGGLI